MRSKNKSRVTSFAVHLRTVLSCRYYKTIANFAGRDLCEFSLRYHLDTVQNKLLRSIHTTVTGLLSGQKSPKLLGRLNNVNDIIADVSQIKIIPHETWRIRPGFRVGSVVVKINMSKTHVVSRPWLVADSPIL